jgi:hypothetical protein
VIPMQVNDLAYARSGDKGDVSNIVVIAKEKRFYPILQKHLTADLVKAFFAEMVKGDVERYNVDTLEAMNFVLRNSLGGGATRSLRLDFTGKTMCQAILRIKLNVEESDLHALR